MSFDDFYLSRRGSVETKQALLTEVAFVFNLTPDLTCQDDFMATLADKMNKDIICELHTSDAASSGKLLAVNHREGGKSHLTEILLRFVLYYVHLYSVDGDKVKL